MRDLIADTVRHCHEIERDTGQLFHYKITTNGTLLDEEFLTDPDTSEVFVAMSLDGVQARTIQSGRCRGLRHVRALQPKIDMLLAHKPYSPVMMTVTPDTAGHYAESVEWLYGRGSITSYAR